MKTFWQLHALLVSLFLDGSDSDSDSGDSDSDSGGSDSDSGSGDGGSVWGDILDNSNSDSGNNNPPRGPGSRSIRPEDLQPGDLGDIPRQNLDGPGR